MRPRCYATGHTTPAGPFVTVGGYIWVGRHVGSLWTLAALSTLTDKRHHAALTLCRECLLKLRLDCLRAGPARQREAAARREAGRQLLGTFSVFRPSAGLVHTYHASQQAVAMGLRYSTRHFPLDPHASSRARLLDAAEAGRPPVGRRGWAELAGELAAGLAEELGAELTGELMGELATELVAEPAGGECVSLAPGAVVRIRPGSLSSLTELEGLGGAVVVEHRGRWRVRMVGEDAGDRDLRSFRLECGWRSGTGGASGGRPQSRLGEAQAAGGLG